MFMMEIDMKTEFGHVFFSFGRSCSSSKLPWLEYHVPKNPEIPGSRLSPSGRMVVMAFRKLKANHVLYMGPDRNMGPRGFGSIKTFHEFCLAKNETTTLYHSEVPEIIKQVLAKKLALLYVV